MMKYVRYENLYGIENYFKDHDSKFNFTFRSTKYKSQLVKFYSSYFEINDMIIMHIFKRYLSDELINKE